MSINPTVDGRMRHNQLRVVTLSIIKINIQSSCEIEDFVETHPRNLCDTPIARITGCCISYAGVQVHVQHRQLCRAALAHTNRPTSPLLPVDLRFDT